MGNLQGSYIVLMLDEILAYNYLNEEIFADCESFRGRIANADYFYTHDGLGSVRNLLDGELFNYIYDYNAFGEFINQGFVMPPLRYSFTGREMDLETSNTDLSGPAETNYYYRARIYDSSTARFTSRDIIKLVNPYFYVRENPVNNVDPKGLNVISKPLVPPLKCGNCECKVKVHVMVEYISSPGGFWTLKTTEYDWINLVNPNKIKNPIWKLRYKYVDKDTFGSDGWFEIWRICLVFDLSECKNTKKAPTCSHLSIMCDGVKAKGALGISWIGSRYACVPVPYKKKRPYTVKFSVIDSGGVGPTVEYIGFLYII